MSEPGAFCVRARRCGGPALSRSLCRGPALWRGAAPRSLALCVGARRCLCRALCCRCSLCRAPTLSASARCSLCRGRHSLCALPGVLCVKGPAVSVSGPGALPAPAMIPISSSMRSFGPRIGCATNVVDTTPCTECVATIPIATSMAPKPERSTPSILNQQTDVLKDTLAYCREGNLSLVWPTLTDHRSDTRDVSQFYEECETTKDKNAGRHVEREAPEWWHWRWRSAKQRAPTRCNPSGCAGPRLRSRVPPIRSTGAPLRSPCHPSGPRALSSHPTCHPCAPPSPVSPQLRSACHPSSPARSLFPGENPKPYFLGDKKVLVLPGASL